MKFHSKSLSMLWKWLLITLGSAVYALGFNWCYKPNDIASGGVTGIAQVINAMCPTIPVGVMVILLNIPLFLLGWKLLGGRLLVSSLYAMAISSVFIDVLDLFYQFQTMDLMLGAIFGGVLMGLSLGLVLMAGATTGGTDLLARLLKLKLAWLPMGKLLLVVDLVVIVVAALCFQNLYSALYGIVALYITSLVMDLVLYGTDTAAVAYIISDHTEEVTRYITHDLDRGVTILNGRGGWSNQEKNVLLVAFKQREIVKLKASVKEIDPNAFLIVCQTHEVLGEGFRDYSKHDL